MSGLGSPFLLHLSPEFRLSFRSLLHSIIHLFSHAFSHSFIHLVELLIIYSFNQQICRKHLLYADTVQCPGDSALSKAKSLASEIF